jgi:hypothetical protein
MAYDYAPVTTPDEEEEERRRLAVTYPPVSAAQPTAIGSSPGPQEGQPRLKPALARFGSTADLATGADQPGAIHPPADYAPAASPALPASPTLGPRPKPSDYQAPTPAGQGGSQLSVPRSSTPNVNDEMESGASRLRMMNMGTLRAQTPGTPYPPLGSTADLEARAAQPRAYPAPEPSAPAPSRPQWSQYAPAEKHGWGKFGSVMASLNPISNEIVNQRPLENAERNYKAATSEYDTNIADREKEAQTNEANARAEALKHPQLGKTPEEQAFGDLIAKGVNPMDAYSQVKQAGQDVKPPTAEEDRRQYGTLLNKQRNGTISSSEERQLGELTSIYPQLAPMGEAAAGQANARIVDSLAQNPSTKKKIASGQVPDEYRILPTDTREEAKDKEARAQALGSAAQREITINENAGERGIETVSAQTPDGPVYESKAAAEAAGHKILNKANPAEREKAKQAYTQYSRMIDNAQEAMSTMPAWKEGSKDRDIAMRVSKQFFSHIPVVGVDPSYVDQFLNSDDYRMMSKQGQAHMQNMFQIWSDAINVVKQETGGVPRGQMFLQKEDAILPHPEKTYDMNVKSLNAFVKRMRKDSEEYSRPIEIPPLQGGIAPADAKGYINKNGKRIGYIDAQGKRVEF